MTNQDAGVCKHPKDKQITNALGQVNCTICGKVLGVKYAGDFGQDAGPSVVTVNPPQTLDAAAKVRQVAVLIAKSRVDGWVQMYPELAPCHRLLEEMLLNRRLRGLLFRRLNVLENVVLIPDESVRRFLWGLVYGEAMLSFGALKAGLETRDVPVWDELISAWRNITHNMQAGLYRRPVAALKGTHNVYKDRPGNKQAWHWLEDSL